MKYSILFCLLIISINLLLGQNRTASVTVDLRKSLGKVNRCIFGNNIIAYEKDTWKSASPDYWDRGAGIWDPDLKRPVPDMVLLAKLAGMSVARYPGGTAVHYFDWKKTIGPILQRPNNKFGLPEFLQFCAEVGAIPMITIAEYFGTEQDARDLVEYLNAPNDGKHLWAKMRTEDGHPTPWNVIWFEYGNETYLSEGTKKIMSDQEYARQYLSYRQAMKSVDPRINLGAVSSIGSQSFNNWSKSVLQIVGDRIDFVIDHFYIPSYRREDGIPEANELFAIGLAAEDQIQNHYDEMQNTLNTLIGRHVPIAVTEFNGAFVQGKPVPYRLSLGNALVNAEIIKVLLNPQNNILMANFWQFSNEYWGLVKGYVYRSESIVKRPPFYVFQLYHEHFGTQLIKADVSCDKYDSWGGYGIKATRDNPKNIEPVDQSVSLSKDWQFANGVGFSNHIEGENLVVIFKGQDVNYFHAKKTFVYEPFMNYRASAWIKTKGLTSANGVCIELIDARGWDAIKSASASAEISGTTDWQKVEVDYTPLPDTKKIDFRARRMSGGGPISGLAYFRDVTVQKIFPKFPAVPYLSVNASRTFELEKTKNSKLKVYLMVINKNMIDSISTSINLKRFTPHRAKTWILSGPSIEATNEIDPENVKIFEHDYGKVKNGFTVQFPPHSLTALEVE